MMVGKTWVAVVLMVLLVAPAGSRIALGQETSDPVIDPLRERVSQFLEGVSSGSTQKAYQELLTGSQLFKQKEAVTALVEETGRIHDLYGEYRAFEAIAAKRVGNDLVLLKYLYKCENFPVVWYFIFYRTPARGELPPERTSNTWRVIAVRFDTELELLGLDKPGT